MESEKEYACFVDRRFTLLEYLNEHLTGINRQQNLPFNPEKYFINNFSALLIVKSLLQ